MLESWYLWITAINYASDPGGNIVISDQQEYDAEARYQILDGFQLRTGYKNNAWPAPRDSDEIEFTVIARSKDDMPAIFDHGEPMQIDLQLWYPNAVHTVRSTVYVSDVRLSIDPTNERWPIAMTVSLVEATAVLETTVYNGPVDAVWRLPAIMPFNPPAYRFLTTAAVCGLTVSYDVNYNYIIYPPNHERRNPSGLSVAQLFSELTTGHWAANMHYSPRARWRTDQPPPEDDTQTWDNGDDVWYWIEATDHRDDLTGTTGIFELDPEARTDLTVSIRDHADIMLGENDYQMIVDACDIEVPLDYRRDGRDIIGTLEYKRPGSTVDDLRNEPQDVPAAIMKSEIRNIPGAANRHLSGTVAHDEVTWYMTEWVHRRFTTSAVAYRADTIPVNLSTMSGRLAEHTGRALHTPDIDERATIQTLVIFNIPESVAFGGYTMQGTVTGIEYRIENGEVWADLQTQPGIGRAYPVDDNALHFDSWDDDGPNMGEFGRITIQDSRWIIFAEAN